MVYISELFPNPSGVDTGKEWIEVCNNGTQMQSLAGWKLQDASAKSFIMNDVLIAPQSCAVLDNAQTKISLNNDKETVSLFDAGGTLIDSVSYEKAVKDDQALARANAGGELQITTTPTKGEMVNVITAPVSRAKAKTSSTTLSGTESMQHETWNMEQGAQDKTWNVEHGTILVPGTGLWEVILVGACVAGVLAVVFTKVAVQLKSK